MGLPGRVIVSGQAAWVTDVRKDPNFPRAAQAAQAGLVSGMAFPVTAGDDVVGVIEAFSPKKIKPARRLLRILNQVGVQLGRVIERDQHQRDLAYRALHDELTGLPNRTLLLEHVATAQARARRSREVVALLLLDIDNFKLTNDALGHETGDQMLAAVGERLSTGMRAMDIVARFSGDEFVILCEGLKDEDEADALARRVQFLLQQQVVGRRPLDECERQHRHRDRQRRRGARGPAARRRHRDVRRQAPRARHDRPVRRLDARGDLRAAAPGR